MMQKLIKNCSRNQLFIENMILRKPCFTIVKAYFSRFQGYINQEKPLPKICANELPKNSANISKNKAKYLQNESQNLSKINKNQEKGIMKIDAKIKTKKERFINPPSPAGSPLATGIPPQTPPLLPRCGLLRCRS